MTTLISMQVWRAVETDGRMAGSIDLGSFAKGVDYGAGSLGFALNPEPAGAASW